MYSLVSVTTKDPNKSVCLHTSVSLLMSLGTGKTLGASVNHYIPLSSVEKSSQVQIFGKNMVAFQLLVYQRQCGPNQKSLRSLAGQMVGRSKSLRFLGKRKGMENGKILPPGFLDFFFLPG